MYNNFASVLAGILEFPSAQNCFWIHSLALRYCSLFLKKTSKKWESIQHITRLHSYLNLIHTHNIIAWKDNITFTLVYGTRVFIGQFTLIWFFGFVLKAIQYVVDIELLKNASNLRQKVYVELHIFQLS